LGAKHHAHRQFGDADLDALVRRAVARCPVADAIGRATPTTVEVHAG